MPIVRSRIALIATLAYMAMVACMWATFARSSGMSYETQLPYFSETGHGFRWEGDPLRVYTSVFYHLSYVIGKVCGIAGSFVPYQFVYAGLWFARGFLVFLILRRVMPDAVVLPFTAGALTIVHASDATLQWVGQMNQAGFIFWALAAIYFFVVAVQGATAFVVLACICECLCLWSYESPLFIICATPFVIAFLMPPESWKRYLALCAAWYLFPAWYVHMAYWRYTHAGLAYQTSVMRKTWSASAILSDLVFNMRHSLSFWSWDLSSDLPERRIIMLAAGAVIVFVIAGCMMRPEKGSRNWRILVAGFVFLILSFPAYLLLDSARSTWRTELLSGFGAAIFISAAIGIIAGRRSWLMLVIAAPLIWWGAHAAIERGAWHRSIWWTHQGVMQEMLRAAPRVENGTVVVLTGVSKSADPFGDDLWFDTAIRLAYPRTQVAGVYFYADQTAGISNNLHLNNGRWTWDRQHFEGLLVDAPVDRTLVLEYSGTGTARVLAEIPRFVCAHCDDYRLQTRIIRDQPSPEAQRRYGPLQ